jgi:dephospho-CoA kinase
MSNKIPLKIGVTGGIGSGKSYVCRLLEERGFAVYYSDTESKKLTNTHHVIREKLISLFGDMVYLDGELNRQFLAEKIFSNEELRLQVNEIIHPIVRADFANWASLQKGDFVFNEAAILFETGGYKEMDFTILVYTDMPIRIERLKKRDGLTEEEILARVQKQWPDEKKLKLADFVIVNDDSHDLQSQIDELILFLKSKIR